jgi:hypothetical protein
VSEVCAYDCRPQRIRLRSPRPPAGPPVGVHSTFSAGAAWAYSWPNADFADGQACTVSPACCPRGCAAHTNHFSAQCLQTS